MGAQQSAAKASFVEAVQPFLNMSDEGIAAAWARFNFLADNWGLTEEQFVSICSVLSHELERDDDDLATCAARAFAMFDTDANGSIDSLEVLASLALFSGMSTDAKLRFLFRCYDFKERGELTLDETTLAFNSTLVGLAKCSGGNDVDISDVESMSRAAFTEAGVDLEQSDGTLRLEDFLVFCQRDAKVSSWLEYYDDSDDQTTRYDAPPRNDADAPAVPEPALARSDVMESTRNGDDVYGFSVVPEDDLENHIEETKEVAESRVAGDDVAAEAGAKESSNADVNAAEGKDGDTSGDSATADADADANAEAKDDAVGEGGADPEADGGAKAEAPAPRDFRSVIARTVPSAFAPAAAEGEAEGEESEEKDGGNEDDGSGEPAEEVPPNPALTEPADAPDAHLELEWVYGCSTRGGPLATSAVGASGISHADSVRFSSSGETIFYAAGVAVVSGAPVAEGEDDAPSGGAVQQRFFMEHSDDITALAVHPNGSTVATGQAGSRPSVVVWSCRTCESTVTIRGYHELGIGFLDFSPGGTLLVSVGLDADHSVAVHDWAARELLFSSRNTQLAVTGCRWGSDTRFATCGTQHIAFWSKDEVADKGYIKKKGFFGAKGQLQDITCLSAVNHAEQMVSGTSSGHIYAWTGRNCKEAVEAHDGAVTALFYSAAAATLLSGGEDGKVRLWTRTVKPKAIFDVRDFGSTFASISSVCISSDGNKGLVATLGSEIIEFNAAPPPVGGAADEGGDDNNELVANVGQVVLRGHDAWHGNVRVLETNPTQNQFCTAGDDQVLCTWNSAEHTLLRSSPLGCNVVAACFAPDGAAIAAVYAGAYKPPPPSQTEMGDEGKEGDEGGEEKQGETEEKKSEDEEGKEDDAEYTASAGGLLILNADDGTVLQQIAVPPVQSTEEVGSSEGDAEADAEGEEKEGDAEILPVATTVKYSPDGALIAVGCDNGAIFVFNAADGALKSSCASPHEGAVSALDFAKGERLLLQSNSGAAGELLFHDAETGERVNALEDVRDVEWATHSCDRTFATQGLHSNRPTVDASNLISLSRTSSGAFFASADQFGRVRLARCPCPAPGARSHAFVGHSSGVASIRFSTDDSQLFSLGSTDGSIFQWKLVLDDEPESGEDWVPGGDAEEVEDAGDGDAEGAPEHEEPLDELEEEDEEAKDTECAQLWACASTTELAKAEETLDFEAEQPWVKTALAPADPPPSGSIPSGGLKLEWVNGYRAQDTHSNCFYTSSGDIVYPAASLGIVLNAKDRKQTFFHGHTRDVTCLAMHPDGTLCATGQVGQRPYVCVWNTQSGELVRKVACGNILCVASIAFSRDGRLIAVCGLDRSHTIAVYEWSTGSRITSLVGGARRALEMAFSPNGAELVVVGVKHFRVVTLRGGLNAVSRRGIFGSKSKIQTVHCVSFVNNSETGEATAVLGATDGSLLKLGGRRVADVVAEAHTKAVTTLFTVTTGPNKGCLLSGGKDGVVKLWDNEASSALAEFDLAKLDGCTTPSVVSVCMRFSEDDDRTRLLVGTRGSEIYELDGSTASKGDEDDSLVFGTNMSKDGGALINGHNRGELWGLAVHPERAEATTVGDDQMMRKWDLLTNKQIAATPLGCLSRACAYSSDGELIIVGLGGSPGGCGRATDAETQFKGTKNGMFKVFTNDDFELVFEGNATKGWVRDVKFSPDGYTVALAGSDGTVYLHSTSDWSAKGMCEAHACSVAHMDFSTDSDFLRSMCDGKELRFFDTNTATEKTAEEMRDVRWATQTCTVGWAVAGSCPPISSSVDPMQLMARIKDRARRGGKTVHQIFGDVDDPSAATIGRDAFERALDGEGFKFTAAQLDALTAPYVVKWERPSRGDVVAWRQFADDAESSMASGVQVNATGRSVSGSLFATADGFGSVRLYSNPCPKRDQHMLEYSGHGTNVTNCGFADNDSLLLTTGGHDRCVFHWRVVQD